MKICLAGLGYRSLPTPANRRHNAALSSGWNYRWGALEEPSGGSDAAAIVYFDDLGIEAPDRVRR